MRQFLYMGFLLILIAGCGRKVSNLSTISIHAPDSANSSGKVGAMAAMPVNRKACYGISVTGPGISGHEASACSPQTGVVAGFIEGGGLIEAQVERGTGRDIKLFVFLQNVGEDLPCPSMGATFLGTQLAQIFLVGNATGIELSQDVQTITIEANFPGETQNIAVTSGMSPSCIDNSGSIKGQGIRISSASEVLSGTGIKMIGRAGRPAQAGELTGTGIKLKIK